MKGAIAKVPHQKLESHVHLALRLGIWLGLGLRASLKIHNLTALIVRNLHTRF